MRRSIIVGNWKMNGDRNAAVSLVQEIQTGVEHLHSVDVVLCPPATYLLTVAESIANTKNLQLGAQNVSEHAYGAYTGEVSSAMLSDVGCDYVIVGHSERRRYCGETDKEVGNKAHAVIEQGMIPIVCVGETIDERQLDLTQTVVERQISTVVDIIGEDNIGMALYAYEPVWAIGTGRTATPEQAQEVHSWIRGQLRAVNRNTADECRILYGGSVNGSNARSVIGQPDVDGCLVGGASLKPSEFLTICSVA